MIRAEDMLFEARDAGGQPAGHWTLAQLVESSVDADALVEDLAWLALLAALDLGCSHADPYDSKLTWTRLS
jgi:hypothetical protein